MWTNQNQFHKAQVSFTSICLVPKGPFLHIRNAILDNNITSSCLNVEKDTNKHIKNCIVHVLSLLILAFFYQVSSTVNLKHG